MHCSFVSRRDDICLAPPAGLVKSCGLEGEMVVGWRERACWLMAERVEQGGHSESEGVDCYTWMWHGLCAVTQTASACTGDR